MKFSTAIEGYLLDIQSSGYSPATVKLYSLYLPKVANYLNDPEIENITTDMLRGFMLYVQSEYTSIRPSGKDLPLSPSAIDNYWKGIRSFFNWATDTFSFQRPDLDLKRPKFRLPEITSFSETEIKKILAACEYTVEIQPKNMRPYRRKRPTAHRDRAIILILLDTGLRIGELCRLTIEDINLETGEVLVAPHGSGQKTKPRLVYLGNIAKKAVWLYMAKENKTRPTDKLFDINHASIRSMMRNIEKRARVFNVHPHRFRHSFAIQFLRNGGDVFSLQRLLGHSSLKMVQHYLDLAQADVQNAHRRSSPADNWKL